MAVKLSVIHEGRYATVYRTNEGKAIKRCKTEDDFSFITFQHDMSILRLIKHERIVELETVEWIAGVTTSPRLVLPLYHCDLGVIFSDVCSRSVLSIPSETGIRDRLYQYRGVSFSIYRVACHLIEGLAVIHAHGFYHGDVKPENILIDCKGNAVLTDFGHSPRHFPSLSSIPPKKVGTIFYRPPESICDDLSIGIDIGAYDIWGAGMVLWELYHKQRLLTSPEKYEMGDELMIAAHEKFYERGESADRVSPPVYCARSHREVRMTTDVPFPLGSMLAYRAEDRPSAQDILMTSSFVRSRMVPKTLDSYDQAVVRHSDNREIVYFLFKLVCRLEISICCLFYAVLLCDILWSDDATSGSLIRDSNLSRTVKVQAIVALRLAEEYLESNFHSIKSYLYTEPSVTISIQEFNEARRSFYQALNFQFVRTTVYDYYRDVPLGPDGDHVLLYAVLSSLLVRWEHGDGKITLLSQRQQFYHCVNIRALIVTDAGGHLTDTNENKILDTMRDGNLLLDYFTCDIADRLRQILMDRKV